MSENEPFGLMPITEEEFGKIRALVYSKFGIALTDQKRTLVVGRLQKLIHTLGLHSFSDYIHYIEKDSSGGSLVELVNRISTNHTFFYREKDHFDFYVRTVLPEMTSRAEVKAQRDLRIWSAGCSSGEEPYTLIMLMKEYFGDQYKNWDAGVLATDISDKVLTIAKNGIYQEDHVDQLPASLRQKYFRKVSDGWSVNEDVKREVTFRHLNLMNSTFPFKKQFHAIFCRNVMIYFDGPTRDGLVQRFFDCTVPGGYLFIGHSESLQRGNCPYDYVCPAVYRKRAI